MVTKGIVLGHIVSSKGIEVDKAKIANLSKPKTVKEVRSFVRHVGIYRRFIKDLDFMLEHIGLVVSQLQSKGKEDHHTLPFKDILSALAEANGMGFHVGWLVSRVTTLRDLQKVGPTIHASLSSLQQLRAKRDSSINKANETKSAMEARITSIANL